MLESCRMKRLARFFTPGFIVVFASGCTYYSVNPQGVPSVPREAAALPLRVGIAWTPPQKWKAYPFYLLSGMADDEYGNCTATGTPKDICDKRYKKWIANEHWNPEHHRFGELLAKKLKAAHLFQDVVFPVPPSLEARAPVDLMIRLEPVEYSFDSHDLGLELFIPLIVPLCDPFLIGCPLANTTDTFASSVRMTLTDKTGRELKSYAEQEKVDTVFPDFNAPPLPGAADKDASSESDERLASDLVKALAEDKSYFAGMSAGGPEQPVSAPAPPAPAQAPAAPQGKTWWQQ